MNPFKDLSFKVYLFFSLFLFVVLIAGYEYYSYIRHLENEYDKLFPSFLKIGEVFYQYAVVPDKRTGDILLWKDTISSMKIYGMSILISAFLGTLFGLIMGLYPIFRAIFYYMINFLANIPPLAILPILLLIFGVGFISKVALIAIGIFPVITLMIYNEVVSIPKEELVKARTLGFSNLELGYKIVLIKILPAIFESLRVVNGTVWLLLIAAEAISATEGLGYRIFLVRRYMSMDLIFAYVIWIVILAFLIDFILKMVNKKLFPWYIKRD